MSTQPFNLGDAAIAAAVAGEVITSASDAEGVTRAYLSGMGDKRGANFQVIFNAGDGLGSTVKLTIETSLDQGVTWIEVARVAFTTTNAQKAFNLSALTPKTALYTPAALSDDTVIDGIFGDLWRAKKTVTGTYGGNATISVRMQPR